VLYVDSDNGLGAPSGDVDDGFAITALLLGGARPAALASIHGNTTEEQAYEDNRVLARLCGFHGSLLRGCVSTESPPSEASRWLAAAGGPVRIVALGPLTNVARALQLQPALAGRVEELIVVGSNSSSRGRWPPYWPFEFNLVKDRSAARAVFDAALPLTLVPLDVARHLTVTVRELDELRGPVGEHVRRNALRWLHRARLWFWSGRVPMWDLVAALYVLDPQLVRLRETVARLHDSGRVEFGRGARLVKLVEGFDRDALWSRFVRLF
jgi:inosine-uridine nucleoside N-ribohydrolase